MVVVIDYGVGNVGSICNMLRKIGASSVASCRPQDIESASHIVLPGVGLFDEAIKNLHTSNILPTIENRVLDRGVPLLGICVGMQLLTNGSEEGQLPGLGWIDANTVKFLPSSGTPGLKVPHMGWNTVDISKSALLFHNIEGEQKFYFLHSYYISCSDQEDILTTTTYGCNFVSSFEKDNIVGVQFHPEKSHKYGMSLLRNFIEYY